MRRSPSSSDRIDQPEHGSDHRSGREVCGATACYLRGTRVPIIPVNRVNRPRIDSGAPRSIFLTQVLVMERLMSWKKPKVVEIAIGTEINAYACAVR
jgi:coenzyme PQQ precursor peptide PqqA